MSAHNDPADGTGTALERRSRELLRASVERLDAHARSRLAQARHAALAAGQRPRPFRVPGLWLPAGALAAAAVLALAVWVGQPGPERAALAEAAAVEDADILASGDGPELYAEEAEFYEWAGGDGPGGAEGGLADPVGAPPAGSAATHG